MKWYDGLVGSGDLKAEEEESINKIINIDVGKELESAKQDLKWFATIVQLRRRCNHRGAHAWGTFLPA